MNRNNNSPPVPPEREDLERQLQSLQRDIRQLQLERDLLGDAELWTSQRELMALSPNVATSLLNLTVRSLHTQQIALLLELLHIVKTHLGHGSPTATSWR